MPEMLIDETFGTDVEVPIEGKAFQGCTFDDCTIVGDKNSIFWDCTFTGQAETRLNEIRASNPMMVIEQGDRIELGPKPPIGPYNELTEP